MPRCVYMVGQLPPLLIRPCTCPLAVHCPFRESQFLWQHPTLVFICRYFFFWFFSCLPDCVMKTLSLSQFFVCVCECVCLYYSVMSLALCFFITHTTRAPATWVCVCVFGLALATFAYCLHLQHITKVAAACTFTLHIYINIYNIYTHYIHFLICRQFAWLVSFLSDKFAASTLAEDDRL